MAKKAPSLEDPVLQIKVAALLMREPGVLETYRDVLHLDYFQYDDIRKVVNQIFLYFDKYGKAPPFDSLGRLLPKNQKKDPYHTKGWKGVLKDIKSIPKEDYEPIQDELADFIKYQIVGAALSASVEHRKQLDWEVLQQQVLEMVEKVNSLNGDLTGSNGNLKGPLLGAGFRSNNVKNVKNVPPELHEAALHGIAGQIVRAIEPHTESHPAALLGHILVFFGNIIGHGPYWRAEATRHALNLFLVLVGDTSRGRKGTAEGHIRGFFEFLDEDWIKNNIVTGVSTGEGLIQRLKDNEEEEDKRKSKRLLAIEPEFSQILKVQGREGNTLSPNLRKAWDDGNLATLTRKEPLTATDAHFSFIGHISKDELLSRLKQEDALSGFGNRILFIHTHRTKLLPSGGDLKELDKVLNPLNMDLREIYNWARLQKKRIIRSKKAEEYWQSLYTVLTKDFPGRFGKITARAEAQTMRLACIYALLDKSSIIKPQHLAAAYGFWKYCEDSCRYIFGDSLGDPVADSILQALKDKPEGLTKTEIRVEVFQKNKKASELNPVLQNLVDCELIVEIKSKTTGGAPSTRFFHVDHYKGDPSDPTFLTLLTSKAKKVASGLLDKAVQVNGNQQLTTIQSNGDLKRSRKTYKPPKRSEEYMEKLTQTLRKRGLGRKE